MIELKGKYNIAKVFTDDIEVEAVNQIINLLNQSFTKNCKIRIMPDVHAVHGCTIGFTANLNDKVIPNLVGVDIGCGVLTIPLGKVDIDYKKFDKILRDNVAYGMTINSKQKKSFDELEDMYCYKDIVKHQYDKILKAIVSGNHFVEIDEDDDENK